MGRMYSAFLFVLLALSVFPSRAQQKVSKWPRGITYEIFVQSFCDSDGNGIGDIKGMTSKLDYLQELGVEGIWLMPINPSPSYHKYDVTDYYGIHPSYGSLDDFKTFISEAHKRGINVVMDMVINHSSKWHPWFVESKNNINNPTRDYYVWTHKDDPQTKTTVKKTNEDSDVRNRWNKVEGSDYLYYSYFGNHMPDLNFDNPRLRDEIFKIGRYWLTEIGVDGFRMDAARHIFPDERAQDNHNWWIYFLSEMQKADKDVYIVGEVWAPVEVVAPYMKGIPALFNFDLGYAITKALKEGRADSIAINHNRIRDFYKSENPGFIDATFLTNHDQNRIMSSLNNDAEKAKMAAAILFTLPGSPYIYYGEEIGMRGKKPDEYIREPFLWSKKAKDKERATWKEPRHSTDADVSPLSEQKGSKSSIFNHYKTLISLRNKSKALTYGEMEPVHTGLSQVSAFKRMFEGEELLVVHNLSGEQVDVSLPGDLKRLEKIKYESKNAAVRKGSIRLPGYSTVVIEK